LRLRVSGAALCKRKWAIYAGCKRVRATSGSFGLSYEHVRLLGTTGSLCRRAPCRRAPLTQRVFEQILGRIERLAWQPTSSGIPDGERMP